MNTKQYASFLKLLLLCVALLLSSIRSLAAASIQPSVSSAEQLAGDSAPKQQDTVVILNPNAGISNSDQDQQPNEASAPSWLVYGLLIVQALWIAFFALAYTMKIGPFAFRWEMIDELKQEQGKLKTKLEDLQASKVKPEQNAVVHKPESPKVERKTSSEQAAPTTDVATLPAMESESSSSPMSKEEPHPIEPQYYYIEGTPAAGDKIQLLSSKPDKCYFQVAIKDDNKGELSLCDNCRNEAESGGVENTLRGCPLIEIVSGAGNGSSFELDSWGEGVIQDQHFTLSNPIKYRRKK
jgi:hypothetical protein